LKEHESDPEKNNLNAIFPFFCILCYIKSYQFGSSDLCSQTFL